MKAVKILLMYIVSIFAILFISVIPKVTLDKGLFNITGFVQETANLVPKFVKPGNWIMSMGEASFPIINIIWKPYLYSASILIGTMAAGTALAFVLARRVRERKAIAAIAAGYFSFFSNLGGGLLVGGAVFFLVSQFDIHGGGFWGYILCFLLAAVIPVSAVFGFFTRMEAGISVSEIKQVHSLFQLLFKTAAWSAAIGLPAAEYLAGTKGISFYMAASLEPVVIAVCLSLMFTLIYVFYAFLILFIKEEEAGIPSGEIWKKRLRAAFDIIKVHFSNPKFAGGFIFLFGLLAFSFCYSAFMGEPIQKVNLLTDGKGRVLSAPPHPPSHYMWFGSDFNGASIRDQLFVGAKYTLIFGLFIALLRVAGGFGLAVIYTFSLKERTRIFINKFVDSIHFLPLSLIAVILLSPILMDRGGGDFEYPFMERIVLEVVILTLLVLPLTTVLIGNEMRLIAREMYVESARTLGGDDRHILWKHIFPQLASRLFIIFGQQFIQVLLIFVHLGIFSLFFGGTLVSLTNLEHPYSSLTNEWSGLISNAKNAFAYGKYWLLLSPLLAFMFCIIAMQFVVQGVQEVQHKKIGVLMPKRRKFKGKKESAEVFALKEEGQFALSSRKKNRVI
ncbi:ABC transporter permease subunit [Peribacillus sp. SCS-37]|uniref:ABC transporter permease subunit n=1 Tax=Paraperibacillus esterisolvens TaxID=3115296 RepID=UPI0039061BB3